MVSYLKPLVRWLNGIAIRYDETKLMFDPVGENPLVSDVFITHAHYNHSGGFEFPAQTKYSTKESREIYETDRRRKIGNWQQVRCGRRLKLGQVEVEAHDAGHMLGAVQYEVITPEENLVYTGHINFTDTLLTSAAEVAPCSMLIIDTSSASHSLMPQPRESVIADIVKWALECVRDRRIPAFEVDPIGGAQELVRIFNTWTEMPVIVHPRIARINRVYENNGVGLRYADASTDEASKIFEESDCVVLVPKRTDLTRYGNFRTAYVSGWARIDRYQDQKIFPLSDQADFGQLLRYVEEARPHSVLTCLGGRASEAFAHLVTKRLGIAAKPLVTESARFVAPSAKVDQERITRCQEFLLEVMQTPDFTYEKGDLMALGMNRGFKRTEMEETLRRLTISGVVKYSKIVDGYRLS